MTLAHSKYSLAAVIALSASTAFAGGYTAAVVEPAPVVPVEAPFTPWKGGYVGADLGYAFGGKDNVGLHDAATGNYIGSAGDLKVHGANIGLRGGYLWQYKTIVFGPEIAYRTGSIKDTQNQSISGTNYDSESKVKNLFSLAWKTGYVFNQNNTMIFGKAGATTAKVDYSLNGESQNFNKSGYVVGFGVEHKIDANWSVVGQYEYYHFGSKDRDFSGITTVASPSFSTVSVGANYRF